MLYLIKSSVYHHALETAIIPILQMREREVAEGIHSLCDLCLKFAARLSLKISVKVFTCKI